MLDPASNISWFVVPQSNSIWCLRDGDDVGCPEIKEIQEVSLSLSREGGDDSELGPSVLEGVGITYERPYKISDYAATFAVEVWF